MNMQISGNGPSPMRDVAPGGDAASMAALVGSGAQGVREADNQTLLELEKMLQGAAGDPANRLDDPVASNGQTAQATLSRLQAFDDSQVSADIFTYLALFQQLAQQMRNTARTQRTVELQGQVTALQNAAEKMKEAAGKRFAAAVVQGVSQIVGGLTQAGMSAYSAKQTIQGVRMEASGNNLVAKANAAAGSNPSGNVANVLQRGNNRIADGKELQAGGTKWAGFSQGASGAINGTGGIIAAGLNHEADLRDAEKANLETQAKLHETGVQHANDMMQQMMEVIRDVREKLASIQQAQVDTTRSIARNI